MQPWPRATHSGFDEVPGLPTRPVRPPARADVPLGRSPWRLPHPGRVIRSASPWRRSRATQRGWLERPATEIVPAAPHPDRAEPLRLHARQGPPDRPRTAVRPSRGPHPPTVEPARSSREAAGRCRTEQRPAICNAAGSAACRCPSSIDTSIRTRAASGSGRTQTGVPSARARRHPGRGLRHSPAEVPLAVRARTQPRRIERRFPRSWQFDRGGACRRLMDLIGHEQRRAAVRIEPSGSDTTHVRLAHRCIPSEVRDRTIHLEAHERDMPPRDGLDPRPPAPIGPHPHAIRPVHDEGEFRSGVRAQSRSRGCRPWMGGHAGGPVPRPRTILHAGH